MHFSRRRFSQLALGSAASAGLLAGSRNAYAQGQRTMGARGSKDREPVGGQPPEGAESSVEDFDYQVKYQRAFEAAIWSMPAVAIYGFRVGTLEYLGLNNNDIMAYSDVATPRLEAITANSTTPYISAVSDLRDGPVVMELPPASSEGSLYGQVVDAWQYTIADVGPSGMDKGQGGKYLFTPPDYEGDIPSGYIHVPSPNYRITLAFRSVRAPGKTTADAYAYAKKIRIYPFAQVDNPPEQVFADPINQRAPTLPRYGLQHFKDIYEIMTVEPVKPEDKIMMGMLASLGIKKGEPFEPDETTRRAMTQASYDFWFFIQNWYDNFPEDQLFWPDRHYASLLQADDNRMFTWTYEDRIDTIDRAAQYFWCTVVPKVLSDNPATQYLMALADNKGDLLEAGATYKVDIPAEMPVKQFWALTVYDRATMAFIYTDSGRTTLSSYDVDNMVKNADGGVTLWVGPRAPEGFESNWIPTAGKRPLPAIRFYGPKPELNNRTFKLPDFERVM